MSDDIAGEAVADDEAELIWFLGDLLIVRMPGERTDEQYMLVEAVGRRGSAAPWHRHRHDDETFHILDGEITLWCGDPSGPVLRGRAGDTVFLPRRIPHAYRVDSATARWLAIGTPAMHERFYREGGEPAPTRTLPPDGPPNMAKLRAAAEKYGIEILGPPPRLGEDRIL